MENQTMMRGLIVAILLLGAANAFAEKKITLVKDGKACFRIVTADTLSPHGGFGAKDLAEFTKKVTGATVKTVRASELANEKEDLINVFIGCKSYGEKYHYDYPIPAGFRIIFPDSRNIIIAGAQLAGEEPNTNDGVYWFIETYLDLHFLMPGELGVYLPPKTNELAVPQKEIQRIPDFFSRQFAGVHGQAYSRSERHEQRQALLHAMRISMNGSSSLKFVHNVGNLLDPEIYMDTHPEFFPLIDGRRHFPPKVPGKWKLNNWEPCYTAKGIVEEAAKNVIKFFDENPTLYSCSLSANDSGNICKCNSCKEINKNLPATSESQTYYEWVAKVVDIVKRKYPNRHYGILNYWATKELPSNLKLDASIVPVICEDFHFYSDPELYEKLEERMRNWDKIASTIGWWDYTFEGAYMIPPYTPHFRARQLKHLYHNHNLRMYFDELQPGRYCKNAPEIYMTMKLLWNIELDPDKLLDEWYEMAVGPKAAPYLREYFEVWEDIWRTKIPQTTWFKERARIGAPFLQRQDGTYLDAISPEDIERATKAVMAAVEQAPKGATRMRAEFFAKYHAMAADTYYLPYINSRRLGKEGQSHRGKLLKHYDFTDGHEPWVP